MSFVSKFIYILLNLYKQRKIIFISIIQIIIIKIPKHWIPKKFQLPEYIKPNSLSKKPEKTKEIIPGKKWHTTALTGSSNLNFST